MYAIASKRTDLDLCLKPSDPTTAETFLRAGGGDRGRRCGETGARNESGAPGKEASHSESESATAGATSQGASRQDDHRLEVQREQAP